MLYQTVCLIKHFLYKKQTLISAIYISVSILILTVSNSINLSQSVAAVELEALPAAFK